MSGSDGPVDAGERAGLDSADIRHTGDDRDEYPSEAGAENRWLVQTGAATAGNGPGSLRTERVNGLGRDRQ
jgi:hypothetical protein